ncbi:FkbM family methyltransferase [Undibacterium sp.]|jgi:FkbM family methyltransferase|uniref:FkbM family methyltransferase n=1 Tax=Undibacterium sp. TaxID=1914977 RepID=UPI002BD9157B|nr:FkbM family methyltransferase [Undibacterium sp.]HTD05890.1 FkbM family methyltransferase [Undibacterium sp.]
MMNWIKTLLGNGLRLYLTHFPIDYGKWRVWKYAEKKGLTKKERVLQSTTRQGVNMSINTKEHLQRFIYFWGLWEHNELRVLRTLLKPGDTFLDLGANIGFFSLVASRIVGERGHVHAFEAIPDTLKELEANILLNSIKNITVHPQAAADREMRVRFAKPADSRSEMNSMRFEVHGENYWEIPCVRVDESIDATQAIKLIKIDIEGAEMMALRGMEKILQQPAKPIILCEVIDEFLKEMNSNAEELFFFLEAHGYQYVYLMENKGLMRLTRTVDGLAGFNHNVVFSAVSLPRYLVRN